MEILELNQILEKRTRSKHAVASFCGCAITSGFISAQISCHFWVRIQLWFFACPIPFLFYLAREFKGYLDFQEEELNQMLRYKNAGFGSIFCTVSFLFSVTLSIQVFLFLLACLS